MPAFDSKLAATLRLDLGDWRRKVIWPSAIATDPLIRTSLYMERGLNPILTAFPNTAFEQITTSAGLRGTLVPSADEYVLDSELAEEDGDEAAFRRNNEAHNSLQRLSLT